MYIFHPYPFHFLLPLRSIRPEHGRLPKQLPIRINDKLHSLVDGLRFQSQSVRMIVGPQIVVGLEQRVRLEGETFRIAHSNADQFEGTAAEQWVFPVVRADFVVEAGDHARVHVCA